MRQHITAYLAQSLLLNLVLFIAVASADPSNGVWNTITAAGPTGRGNPGAAIIDPALNRMLIFGGNFWNSQDNLWALSLAQQPTWTHITPPAPLPNAVVDAQCIYDPAGHRMFAINGFDRVNELSETWSLTLTPPESWTQLSFQEPTPPKRTGHSLIYDTLRNRIVMYGGWSTSNPYQWHTDTWALNLDPAPTWQQVVPDNLGPTGRIYHSTVYDPLRDRLLLFGGSRYGALTNQLWELSLSPTYAWHLIAIQGAAPPARYGQSMVYDSRRDRLIVFGGSAGDAGVLNDVWAFDLSANTWTQLAPALSAGLGLPPAERGFHCAVYDSLGDRMVVFGGSTFGHTALSDTWALRFSEPTSEPDTITMSPSTGGNCGYVTTAISGGHFLGNGAFHLELADGYSISPAAQAIGADGRLATVAFDLRGAPAGDYDLVYDGDTQVIRKHAAFAVSSACEPPALWVSVSGPSVYAADRIARYCITYGNSGNNDAYGGELWISGIPHDADVTFIGDRRPSEVLPIAAPDTGRKVFQTADDQRGFFFLPVISAQSSASLVIAITTSEAASYTLLAELYGPRFSTDQLDLQLGERRLKTSSALPSEYTDCLQAAATAAFDVVSAVPLLGCGAQIGLEIAAGLNTVMAWARDLDAFAADPLAEGKSEAFAYSGVQIITAIGASTMSVAVACGENAVGASFVANAIAAAVDGQRLGTDCARAYLKWEESRHDAHRVGSIDPNTKTGPVGAGAGRYIASTEPVTYTILFENLATATAPAQRVVVQDDVDPATLRTSTIRFGPIAFGNHVIYPMPGVVNQEIDYDLRPEAPIVVKVDVDRDVSGRISWRLQAIDSETGLPPEDPLAGFLPPNLNPPAGEGAVTFAVEPSAGVVSGAPVTNSANIVFDANDPLVTNVWENAYDCDKPTSQVTALGDITFQREFLVSWSGFDGTCGVDNYTIAVSDDGGEFYTWLARTKETSGVFAGEVGHDYAFCSIARDCAGNREEKELSAETSIHVAEAATGPAICTLGPGFYGKAGGNFEGRSTASILTDLLARPLIVGVYGRRSLWIDKEGVECLMEALPGGGRPGPLLEEGDEVLGGSGACEGDAWANSLLAHTTTLGLNMRLMTSLGEVHLEPTLCTAAAGAGSDGTFGTRDDAVDLSRATRSESIDDAVISWVVSVTGRKDVKGLFYAANIALAGYDVAVPYGDVVKALKIVNEAFSDWRVRIECRDESVSKDARKGYVEDVVGFAFEGNYPNPFGSETRIAFTLPVRTTVKVTIYDVSGRRVCTLLDGEVIEAGRHEIVWDGRDGWKRTAAAGVYLCRMEAGDRVALRRMLMLK